MGNYTPYKLDVIANRCSDLNYTVLVKEYPGPHQEDIMLTTQRN